MHGARQTEAKPAAVTQRSVVSLLVVLGVVACGQPPTAATPSAIYGEWGLGQSRNGGSWWAFKRPDNPSLDGTEDISRDGEEDRHCPSCNVVEFDDFTR